MLFRNRTSVLPLFLCLLLVALVFGQLNDQSVSLDLLFARVNNLSLFTFFVITFVGGGLMGLSISFVSSLTQGREIQKLRKQLDKFEQEKPVNTTEGS